MKHAASGKERQKGECRNFTLTHCLDPAGTEKIPLTEANKPLAQMLEVLLTAFGFVMCFGRAGEERLWSAHCTTGIKNPIKFVRIPFSERIPSEGWQNAGLPVYVIGSGRLAVTTIASLSVLFGAGLLPAPIFDRAMNV